MRARANIRMGHLEVRDRGRTGFTLVETLLALAIMVLLTAMVATAIPVAIEAYTKAVDTSNAQTLLSTATSVLRDELSLSQGVDPNDESFYITSNGYWAKLEGGSDGASIQKQVYRDADHSVKAGDPVPLVPGTSQAGDFHVKFDSLDYADGVFTVNGLKVVRASDESAVLATIGESAGGQFKVKVVMSQGSEVGL